MAQRFGSIVISSTRTNETILLELTENIAVVVVFRSKMDRCWWAFDKIYIFFLG